VKRRIRAAEAGEVASFDEATVAEADLIVSSSFQAPRVAASLAKTLAKTPKQGVLFLDANAISPITAEEIDRMLKTAGVSLRMAVSSAGRQAGKGGYLRLGSGGRKIKGLEGFD
jgi:3-hydroxyisobutyrate dehydrogenase-like beta-hydroxyacid dehydrogenase